MNVEIKQSIDRKKWLETLHVRGGDDSVLMA